MEKRIIDGTTIINTVDGDITVVSTIEAMTTIKASGPTERPKSHAMTDLISVRKKAFVMTLQKVSK